MTPPVLPSKSLLLLLSLSGLFVATSSAVLPETDMPPVRATIARSLPFIEKIGVEWMNQKNCNSCHVVTFLVWSHRAAAARGVSVDGKKLAEWTQWALADAHSDRYWFKL